MLRILLERKEVGSAPSEAGFQQKRSCDIYLERSTIIP